MLFEEASKATLDIEKKEESLLNIQKCLSQPEDVIIKSALKAHLTKLQEKIEMAYLAIKRREGNVRNVTSKLFGYTSIFYTQMYMIVLCCKT